jgi:hypothetical protein
MSRMEIGMLQGFVFRKNNDISRKYYDMTCVNSKLTRSINTPKSLYKIYQIIDVDLNK